MNTATVLKTQTGPELYRKAQQIIPGGTQLLSKRPQMFLPEQWPAYFAKAKGVNVWDLDGNCYLDAAQFGVGAPILGFADSDVDEAVIGAIRQGIATTLNCPEEIELAELLLELHSWADMVRYARGGGEIMAIAVRIARAATGRDKVAVCGYHGWQDWYLAANLAHDKALDGHLLPGLKPAGVPRGLAGTLRTFRYNALNELNRIVEDEGGQLAAIVMEPARSVGPMPGFLEGVREIASRVGAVLIFDEITSGWRMNTGGIHLRYGVNPDMAAFAKGVANGYAMAAVIGRRSVMDAAQSTFISSTNWTERVGPSAALATIRKHRRCNAGAHLTATGERVAAGWRTVADKAGLKIHTDGIPPLSHFGFDHPEALALSTYFIQEMLDRHILASNSFYASLAHDEQSVGRYLTAVEEVFQLVADAIRKDDVGQRLRGPLKHSGFQRLV